MLEPAIMHKEKLLELFSKEIYSENYFLYVGYPHYPEPPKIDPTENCYQWAIVDKDSVIGYFSYCIDPLTDCVSKFGLYSFNHRSPIIGYDTFKMMEKLVKTHHRIEWRVIAGNPVVRHYDKFCERHKGKKLVLHDATKAPDGSYRDEYIYEIIAFERCEKPGKE